MNIFKGHNNNISILSDLFDDFCNKKNEYKIKSDNIKADLEYVNTCLDIKLQNIDESDIFSPRDIVSNDSSYIEKLTQKKKSLELEYNNSISSYEYYDKYVQRLNVVLNSYLIDDENDTSESLEKYNLNLNYSNYDDKLVSKLTIISHKLDSIKNILINDPERAIKEIDVISKSIDSILLSIK